MKGKQEVNPVEIRLGSITLFHEPEPELPDLIMQAQTVAEFMTGVYRHNLFGSDLDPAILHKYERLAAGDIGAAYKQHSAEEVEQEKQRVMMYDETMMDKLLLPVEQQLMLDFHNARAQLWATEFGEHLSWQNWDTIRRNCKIKQGKASSAVKESRSKKGSTSANDTAHRVITAALQEVGHTDVEVRALESAVAQQMFVLSRVATPFHASNPVQLPERVPQWAWKSGLSLLVNGWWLIKADDNLIPQLPENLIAVPSAKPMLMADRALRGHRMWEIGNIIEYKEKTSPGISLQYFSETLDSAQLNKALKTLDPRTSDVWRLVLAKALEDGGGQVYTPIKLDVRELAKALGYKPHHKGGMKPEQLREVAEALEHIERLYIQLTPEANTLEYDKQQKKRKTKTLEQVRQERILVIMAKTGQRNLFGDVHYIEWEIALGPWARYFDRSFAPIFRTLVQLPGRGSTNIWAKQIGTELAYYYRQDRAADPKNPQQRRAVKRLKVRTLLERACLLPEFEDMHAARNHRRAVRYFDEAMDLLQKHGVHEGWAYDQSEYEALGQLEGKPGWAEGWLNCNVEITAPQTILSVLPSPVQKKALKG